MNEERATPPADDDVPVGTCPPRSKSIVVIAAVVWGAWFSFLVWMMVERITHAMR